MRMKTVSGLLSVVLLSGCSNAAKDSKADMQSAQGTGISADQSAPIEKAEIDRFSEQAGHLMVRSATNGLPAANASINFDQGPFLTRGLTASGRSVQYYNFDVQSTNPAPIYVLFYEGASEPVANQMNIIDALPGEAGYSDFWKVIKVTVPADYTANSIKSFEELTAAKFPIEKTDLIVNCPVVPEGSIATKRMEGESADLHTGWYRNKMVYYFSFGARPMMANRAGEVPTSPIYVTFNINPDQADGGPASGFKTEAASQQTHNVIATIPSDKGYSPLWSVAVYDNNDFSSVKDLASATQAKIFNPHVADVNCPVAMVDMY